MATGLWLVGVNVTNSCTVTFFVFSHKCKHIYDALVLKHQAISINSANKIYFIGPVPYRTITFIGSNIGK